MSLIFAFLFASVTRAHADDGWCTMVDYQEDRATFIDFAAGYIRPAVAEDGLFTIMTERVVVMTRPARRDAPSLLVNKRNTDDLVEILGKNVRLGRWENATMVWDEAKCHDGTARRKINIILNWAYADLFKEVYRRLN